MQGTNATNGKPLAGVEHLRQSLRDILTTPIGTRVMRRDYGSRLYQLVDAPLNRSTIMQLYAATADAVRKWEPRIKLQRVRIATANPGSVSLDLTGIYLPDGEEVKIDGLVVR